MAGHDEKSSAKRKGPQVPQLQRRQTECRVQPCRCLQAAAGGGDGDTSQRMGSPGHCSPRWRALGVTRTVNTVAVLSQWWPPPESGYYEGLTQREVEEWQHS